jgi:hypothetical protein
LFEGGSDVSLDHLRWSYVEYLNQTSLLLTRALWKNYYNISSNNKFNFFIKTFTILISSQSTDKSFSLSSNPIFDTILSRKSLINILNFIGKNISFETSNYFFNKSDFNLLKHSLFFAYKFDFYNFFVTSGLDIYTLLKNSNSNFLTKTNSTNLWDDKRYWLFSFFRSF